MNSLLRLSSISKSFAGVQALNGVSFDLAPGEVHALVGENGAGKSTLIKIITGAHAPDDGAIEIDGKPVVHNEPRSAHKLGIAAIYQQPALFPDLLVTENISLGVERRGWWERIDWNGQRRRAVELLARAGALIDPDSEVRQLSMPEQQLVEIARALGSNARVLIMDEPTASLSEREVERLFSVVRDLRASGVGIIYISHRLEELELIADRVTVLRDGASLGTFPMASVNRAALIRKMVGRELSAVFPKIDVAAGGVALEVRDLGCRDSGVAGVSFSVRRGEILGMAGLVGAGRTEVARVLFGLTPADHGELLIDGRAIVIDSPQRAVELGIAYVPEDRRRHGVILEMSVSQNATLGILRRIALGGWLQFRKERSLARGFVDRLAIKTPSLDAPAGNLSGGNQQKVALARWLATEPKILILDEPTQGIDVGAKAEIHRLMGELAKQGMAIVMISSELPEILGMSDRVAVMRGGTVVAVLNRAEATQERILAHALGHAEAEAASA